LNRIISKAVTTKNLDTSKREIGTNYRLKLASLAENCQLKTQLNSIAIISQQKDRTRAHCAIALGCMLRCSADGISITYLKFPA